MSLLNVFDIAGSAMTAQALRLNTVASNFAS
jgi:flagellar basal body rod protein FlgC